VHESVPVHHPHGPYFSPSSGLRYARIFSELHDLSCFLSKEVTLTLSKSTVSVIEAPRDFLFCIPLLRDLVFDKNVLIFGCSWFLVFGRRSILPRLRLQAPTRCIVSLFSVVLWRMPFSTFQPYRFFPLSSNGDLLLSASIFPGRV